MNYKYSCSSLEFLNMESGVFAIPKKYNLTIVPAVEGDLAYVNGEEYIFRDGIWEFVKVIEQE